jgi:hypothetical protein
MKETCRATAAAIKAEDGLRNAVDLLDTYFSLKS